MTNHVNHVTLLIGGRGTGKTTYIKETMILSSPLKKKLIIDTFDNPVWRDMESVNHPENSNIPIPVMDISKIKYWKSGIYRSYSSRPHELFEVVKEDLYNTTLVLDDATKIIPNSKCPSDIMEFIWDSKQKNLNVVLAFHSLMDVPANLVRACDYLCLGKTNDARVPNKFDFLPELPKIFEYINKQSKNRYEKFTLQLN